MRFGLKKGLASRLATPPAHPAGFCFRDRLITVPAYRRAAVTGRRPSEKVSPFRRACAPREQLAGVPEDRVAVAGLATARRGRTAAPARGEEPARLTRSRTLAIHEHC